MEVAPDMSLESTAATDPPGRPVYLVTGATGAIGFAIACQAAASGNTVAVHGSAAESVATTIAKIRSHYPAARLIAAPADFRQSGAPAELVSSVVNAGGALDAIIHCAITGAPGVVGAFAATEPGSYAEHTALVLGRFQQLCFHALPHLARQRGSIVAFSSDAGRYGAPRQSLIGAANAGLMGFVRNLALEVAREGVRVNCISPGFVEGTPAFEKYAAGGRGETARKRAGLGLPRPEDIAPLALFLAGAGAAKITGQVISINGGINA
jgi:3-oxoacyl-[acyl-carrier protein] reductase